MTNPWVGEQSHYRAVLAFAHRTHGELLVAADKWEVALSSYREAIAVDKSLSADFPEIPRHWEHLRRDEERLLQLLTNNGRIDEDGEILAESPAQDSRHTARVTQIDAILDEMRDTVNRTSALLAENPDHPRFAEIAITARRALVDAYVLVGRDSDALQQLDEMIEAAGDEAIANQYHLRASLLRLNQQDWDGVIEDLSVVVEADPDDISSRLMLAEAYLRTGQNDAAIEQADEVTRREPHNATAYGRRGRAWIGIGDQGKGAEAFEKALEQIDEALRQDPQFFWMRSARGEAHARLGHWAEAAADFQAFCELGPDALDVWRKTAVLNLMAGDVESYREFCGSLLSRWEELDEGMRHTLSHFCLLGPDAVNDVVVDWISEHAEQQPNSPYWNQFYRGALVRTGEYQQAIDHFMAQGQIEGLDFQDKIWLAMAYHHLGQAEEATKWLDEAATEFAATQRAYWYDRLQQEVLVNEAVSLIAPNLAVPTTEEPAQSPDP